MTSGKVLVDVAGPREAYRTGIRVFSEQRFSAPDFAIARLSLVSGAALPFKLPDTFEDVDALRDFLLAAAANATIREAIAVSSLPLDETLDRVVSGAHVKPTQLRRAALSVIRYVSRMRNRATPFGVMAGVASVSFAEKSKVRIGAGHRKHVRPGMTWLTEVIRGLTHDPTVLSQLTIVANDLSRTRGDQLVLPQVLSADHNRELDGREQTVRRTGQIDVAMKAARTSVSYVALKALVADACNADEAQIEITLMELIDSGFLLTDLYPPTTSPDPLRHVLNMLSRTDQCATRQGIERVNEALNDYAAAPVGSGHQLLRLAASAMRRIYATDRLMHVDLGLDADIVLPRQVATELEQAASVAWTMAMPASYSLAGYRDEFVERYGLSGRVPLKELLDPHRGLGAPADYRMPPSHRKPAQQNSADGERDHLLSGLAYRAGTHNEPEIVIDDELVTRLASRRAQDSAATYIEPCVRILADSEDRLNAGDFRLVLSPVNFTRPGAMFGRFVHLLPELHEPLTECLGRLAAGWASATAVQLAGVTAHAWSANVTQVPQFTPGVLAAGVFADTRDPDVLTIDDLAVGSTRDRLFVVSRRTGGEVVPLMFHANEVRSSATNEIRFLFQMGAARTPRWSFWNWGSVAKWLPYLPRVRYGRTILAPARWLSSPKFVNTTLNWQDWKREVDEWRTEWTVSDQVEMVQGDQLLPLNLGSETDLRILRDELKGNAHKVVFQEQALNGEYGTGWAGGRAVEIALPLLPLRQQEYSSVKTQLPLQVAVSAATTRPVHRPGGEWLYVKAYATANCHDEILVRHLPTLLNRVASTTDRWHFLRYDDDGPHLRIRFHTTSTELSIEILSAVHDWAEQLASVGLLADIAINTYRPEVTRYGGPAALRPAEEMFCADALAAVGQLAQRDRGMLKLPIEMLVAANYLDLAARLYGTGWQQWLLTAYPKNEYHQVFQYQRPQATQLLSPRDQSALTKLDGGTELLELWENRASRVEHYGTVVRGLVDDGQLASVTGPFRSVLHMHHNRLAGINWQTEQGAFAIARGVVQAHIDRDRHLGR